MDNKLATLFLAISLGITPLLVIPQSTDPIVPIQMLALSGLAMLLLVALRRKVMDVGVEKWPHIFWWIFILWGIISSVFGMVPLDGFAETLRLLTMTGVGYLLSWSLAQFDHPNKLLCNITSFAVLVLSAIAIGQSQGFFTEIPGYDGRPTATMGNSNFLGAALQLLLPGAALGLRFKGRQQIISVLSLISGALGLYLAHSLAALLGLVAGICVSLLFLFPHQRQGLGRFRLYSEILLAILVISGLTYAFYGRIAAIRSADVKINTTQDSGAERIMMWQQSFEVMKEHPILGCGPDNWNYAVLAKGLVGQHQGFGTRYFIQAHNDYFQAFAEYGVVGGMAFMLFLGSAFLLGWRRQRLAETGEARWLSALAIGALTGWLVNAGLSFPFHRPYLLVMLLFWIAVLERKPQGSVRFGKWQGRAMLSFLVIISVSATVWYSLKLKANHANDRLLTAKAAQDWESVVTYADQAQSWYNRDDSESKTPIGWYKGNALLNLGSNEEALATLEAAYKCNPWHPMVASNLAVAFVMQGEPKKAIALLEKTILVFPGFDESRINLTALFLQAGEWKKAETLLGYWSDDKTNAMVNQLRSDLERVKNGMLPGK